MYWLSSIASSAAPYWLLSRALLITALTLRYSNFTARFSFFLVIMIIILYALTSTEYAGAIFIDWTLGHLLVSELLSAHDFLVISGDPHVHFRPASSSCTEDRQKWKERSYTERLGWTLSLTTSLRGIGWDHEPRKGVLAPSRPLQSRRYRTFAQILDVCWFLGLMLFNDILIKMNPVFRFGSPGVRSMGPYWQFLACTSAGLTVYSAFSLGHASWELVCVGIFGSDRPGQWRPLYGGVNEAWTVTRFWGVTWHQVMRRFLSAHATFFTRHILRIRKGSALNSLAQVSLAFLLSGIIHQTGEYMVAREQGKSWWNDGGGSFCFFILQPVAVGIERIIGLGSFSDKPSKRARMFGYLWVVFWFYLTVPVWLDGGVKVGLMDQDIGLVFPSIFNVLPENWNQYRHHPK
ncbi:hypothetical protein PM082_020145 [Marasmius tenuissimus]|nr:hypothetical protein PM082_020145 [Marasmius tenuissimus]